MSRTQSGGGVGGRRGPAARRPGERARPPEDPRKRATPPPLVGLRPDPISTLEAHSQQIKDPVEKLRYLRRSLQRYEDIDHKLQAVPGAPLRWLAYRFTGVKTARPLFSSNPNGANDSQARSRTPLPRRARRVLNVAGALLVAAAGIALAAYPRARQVASESPQPDASGRTALWPVAEALPEQPRGVAPERIWLVDQGTGYELYSNGLRIDTTHTVPGEPRRYFVFDLERGLEVEPRSQPIGIVYHTSESDVWPLEESFNERLRDSSQNLLRYLRNNKVYHYLIDRFGQVHRVVQDETKANHAGMSVWDAGGRVYLNLNGPTIGVSFETRWEGGHALPITRAQLEAGRSLTDFLRQRWSIEPEMCLAHGLASVNAKRHLIGHHIDWARGFPFAAYGLPDQYQRPAPAVALFGFEHDESLEARMGDPWPGVAEAERLLVAEAEKQGRPPAEYRQERKRLYDRWLTEQNQADRSSTTRAEAQERRPGSGG